jgi:hypothetical protein
LDVLDPLALLSRPFEDLFCNFFTIEVSASSRELEALIDRGHVLVFLLKRSSGKLMATCRRGHARMSHDPFSEFY